MPVVSFVAAIVYVYAVPFVKPVSLNLNEKFTPSMTSIEKTLLVILLVIVKVDISEPKVEPFFAPCTISSKLVEFRGVMLALEATAIGTVE